jgi:hypothetical protein
MNMFKRINNWFRSPGKTFGSGWAPVSREIADKPLPQRQFRFSKATANRKRQKDKAVAKRRKATKVANESRRINRST